MNYQNNGVKHYQQSSEEQNNQKLQLNQSDKQQVKEGTDFQEANTALENESIQNPYHSNLEGRRDRQGKIIQKGQKEHHIAFRDEIPINTNNSQRHIDDYSDSDKEENKKNDIAQQNGGEMAIKKERLHRKKRKEALSDIIYVESYKEYNQADQNWYSNQCCNIL